MKGKKNWQQSKQNWLNAFEDTFYFAHLGPRLWGKKDAHSTFGHCLQLHCLFFIILE